MMLVDTMGEPDWGTYTLLIDCPHQTTVSVGALGECTFDCNFYVYTGSACGSGGFSRLERHYRTVEADDPTTHWHIDYLLAQPEVEIITDITAPGFEIECEVVRALTLDTTVSRFGSSDCACDAHLHGGDDLQEVHSAVWDAYTMAMNLDEQ